MSLALVALALRAGLEMRRRRHAGERRGRELVARHLRLAKPAVYMIAAGFLGGPLSAWWLRGWTPGRTFHAGLGVVAAALFLSAGVMGHRILRGKSRAVDAHGWLGLLGMLVAAVAAVAGFVLLP
ncbi:MAG: hypothetical protein JRG92_16480 [Deltaproteobacteria bacterium]|nr:hypothetical protein [Deltaproteobacteria bacterium]MBW2385230.1 hypothetical protein [Deltaproteobacteria bacterium]